MKLPIQSIGILREVYSKPAYSGLIFAQGQSSSSTLRSLDINRFPKILQPLLADGCVTVPIGGGGSSHCCCDTIFGNKVCGCLTIVPPFEP